MKHRLFIDMDGVVAEWRGHCKFEDLFEEYYFSTLEPQRWIINDLKEYLFINAGEVELYVITSVLTDSPYALNEKKRMAR